MDSEGERICFEACTRLGIKFLKVSHSAQRTNELDILEFYLNSNPVFTKADAVAL